MSKAALAVVIAGLIAVGCGPRPAASSQQSPSSSAMNSLIFYLPNRIVDLTDIVSLGIGVPSIPDLFVSSAHVNLHATRFVQLGAGSTHGLFMGKSYGREFSWTLSHKELSVGPLTTTQLRWQGQTTAQVERVGVLEPSDSPFVQGRMDYWGIGAHVGLLPLAVSVELHPGEVLDFIAGLFFIDLMEDDVVRPRSPQPVPPAPAPAPAK